MARGGHHGGGGHVGGHHGGGFHGGFSGGGSYGGGSHGGGNYSDEFSFADFILNWGLVIILLIVYGIIKIAQGAVSGLDLINLGIFCLSGLFFYLALKEYKRTAALNGFKRLFRPVYSGKIWKGRKPYDRNGDRYTWVGKYEKNYYVSFTDNEFGPENARKVNETMTMTPRIIWMNSFVWLVIGVISFFNTFWFYEMVIPYFEQATMTDEAFAFMDDFIFYLPSFVTLLCSMSCYVFMLIKDNLLYKCAVRIVADNKAEEERLRTQEYIASQLSKKWYYNVCPNCGSEASNDVISCTHCGTSLEVRSFESENPSAVHRISSEAECKGAGEVNVDEKENAQ
ncbi:MAG: zinc ribbon domain-containing protein [Saccharofermentans sp.]|nr:zinc ribbon domain-containing protein [Saccharofermentans sp.]